MINLAMEITAVIGIFILSYFLIVKDFKFSLYVLIALSVLLHKELFSFYRWDLMPVRAFMFALLLAGVVKCVYAFLRKSYKNDLKSVASDPMVFLVIALWVARGISIFNSMNLQASLLLYGFFTTIVMLAIYLNKHIAADPDQSFKYIKFILHVSLVLILFACAQLVYFLITGHVIGAFWVIPKNIPRVGSLFWDVNHYGSFLAALLPVSALFVIFEKGYRKKIFYTVLTLLIAASLLLTSSRTSWIIEFFAVIFFSAFVLIKKLGLKGIIYLVLGFTLLASPFVYMYSIKDSAFRAGIKHYINYRVDSSDSHMLLLQGAYEIFEKHPIIGGGYGSFFEHFNKTSVASAFFGRDPASLNNRVPAHTIWGELFSETGILGVSVYFLIAVLQVLLLVYVFFRYPGKKQAYLSLAMAAVYFGWMVAGVFYSYNFELFWIVNLIYYFYGVGLLKSFSNMQEFFEYYANSKLIFFGVALLAGVMIFINLGSYNLIPWDEAIYAKISKNMLETGNYLTQQWIPGKVWYEKPPLFMWLVAFSMKIFGITSFAAKLPSALLGLAGVLMAFIWGKRMFGKVAGFISAFALLTTVQYLFYSRMAMTDVTCALFITLALYFYYLFRVDERSGYFNNIKSVVLFGLFTGFAIMTKGVVGLSVFMVVAAYELWCFLFVKREIFKDTLIKIAVGIAVSVLVALPWHIYMYALYGTDFLKNYIGYHVLERVTENIEDKGQPVYWYIIILKVSMRLWFAGLLLSLPVVANKLFKKDKKVIFIFLYALVLFLIFSLSKSKLVWYITPVYFPLALLLGYSFNEIKEYLYKTFKIPAVYYLRFLLMYAFIVFVLSYIFYQRNMLFPGDATGDSAELIKLKDSTFGVDQLVYLDRIELPVAYFYSDGPFKIIDFNADPEKRRIPDVGFDEKLVLITKKGRYSEYVYKYDYHGQVVRESGDYILWYFNSRLEEYTGQLLLINNEIAKIVGLSGTTDPDIANMAPEIKNRYDALLLEKKSLEDKLAR